MIKGKPSSSPLKNNMATPLLGIVVMETTVSTDAVINFVQRHVLRNVFVI